jgi:RNA polymerase sigma factor (sigma-70 family)
VPTEAEDLRLSGGVTPDAPVVSLRDKQQPARAISDPDRDLAAGAGAGDREAFETLIRRHYDRIHRVAFRLVGIAADAEDIAQEVCCTLAEKIGTFRGEAKFTTWLTGIVVNAASDHRRRNAARARLRGQVTVLAELHPGPDGRDLIDRAFMASAISRLDQPLRDAVILVIGEAMSHAEAASALGVAESTVSWRMHRARAILTEAAGKEAQDGL